MMQAQVSVELMKKWQETIRLGNNNLQESNLWSFIEQSEMRATYLWQEVKEKTSNHAETF